MGQKTHPYGFRLGITKDWLGKWYASKKDYSKYLIEDYKIRRKLESLGPNAGISKIEIIRKSGNELHVVIYSARPGMLIGKKGAEINKLEDMVREAVVDKNAKPKIEVKEVKHPEIDACLIAQGVIQKLEQNVSHKRAIKQAITRAMRAGAKGIKIQVSGRLGGAEIARSEWFREGRVPLQTLTADIDYSEMPALTKFGRIGVKVWVYKGEAKPVIFFAEEQ
jgi:small subunit ribosomal protein S3